MSLVRTGWLHGRPGVPPGKGVPYWKRRELNGGDRVDESTGSTQSRCAPPHRRLCSFT